MLANIIAKLKAKDGKKKELEETCKKLAKEVHEKEEGCLKYELFVSREDPNEIWVVEEYKDDNAIDEHMNSPHFNEAKEKFGELLAEEPEINIIDRLND